MSTERNSHCAAPSADANIFVPSALGRFHARRILAPVANLNVLILWDGRVLRGFQNRCSIPVSHLLAREVKQDYPALIGREARPERPGGPARGKPGKIRFEEATEKESNQKCVHVPLPCLREIGFRVTPRAARTRPFVGVRAQALVGWHAICTCIVLLRDGVHEEHEHHIVLRTSCGGAHDGGNRV